MHEVDTKKTLYENFTNKIQSLLPISFIKPFYKHKRFFLDKAATSIINNFLPKLKYKKTLFLAKKHFPQKVFSAKKPHCLAAKFIQLLFSNQSVSLLFDLNDIFSNLVYERIKSVNKGKNVHSLHDGICIKDPNQSTFVYTNFKSFDMKNFAYEIEFIQKKIEQESHQLIYLVYPKSSEFQKHIELKIPHIGLSEDEYKVKLVPYSFSFCLKNFKGEKQCK